MALIASGLHNIHSWNKTDYFHLQLLDAAPNEGCNFKGKTYQYRLKFAHAHFPEFVSNLQPSSAGNTHSFD
jgi:hypothetical protein